MTVTAHHTIAPNITRPTKPLRASVSGVESGVTKLYLSVCGSGYLRAVFSFNDTKHCYS